MLSVPVILMGIFVLCEVRSMSGHEITINPSENSFRISDDRPYISKFFIMYNWLIFVRCICCQKDEIHSFVLDLVTSIEIIPHEYSTDEGIYYTYTLKLHGEDGDLYDSTFEFVYI
jgi:hypothetical protein